MNEPSPKISAPALLKQVVLPRAIKHMGLPDTLGAHWVFAGPGAGKTQLARLWLEQIGRPFAWLQLEALDNEPLLFLEQLRLALSPLVHPQVQLPRFGPQLGVSLQMHCEYLWNLLLETLRAPCVIVLDDAHHIEAWPQHPVLHSLLCGLDTRAHLLILSRTDIDDHYIRAVINRRIKRVGPELFTWQAPQLQAWVRQNWNGWELGDDTTSTILELSQGRAAILALLDLKALLQNPQSPRKQAARELELSELMESSLLSRLSPEAIEPLTYLACLGSFPAHWPVTLNFPTATRDCLERWERSFSVVHRLEQDKAELRFHPLFAEILRAFGERTQRLHSEFRERIVDACVEKGRYLDAISLCQRTKDWSGYWKHLKTVGLQWIERGQISSLARALSDLPDAVQQTLKGPTFSLFLAASTLATDPKRAYKHALDALQQSQDRPELRTLWSHAVATTVHAAIASGLHLGHLLPVIEPIHAALQAPWFVEMSPERRLLVLQAGMLASITDHDRLPIETLYRETDRAMRSCKDIDIQAAMVSALARVLLLHGVPEYVQGIELHIARTKHLASTPAAQLSLIHAKLHQAQTRGEYAIAEGHARSLVSKASAQAPLIWIAEALASGAFCAAASQNIAQTKFYLQKLLKQTSEHQDTGSNFTLHALMYQGCVAAHDGKWSDATKYFQEAVRAADAHRYSLMQVCARSVLAIVSLEHRPLQESRALLQEIESLIEKSSLPLSKSVCASVRAFYAIRTQPLHEAKLVARAMLERMDRTDHYLQVAAMLPQYAELLGFALTHRIKPQLIRKLIRRGSIYPNQRPHPLWPAYIEVQVLGRFQIQINGQDARHRVVSTGRRFELLTALLWKNGKDLSYDECIAWIWTHIPDRARAIRSIKTALKRLNEDLGRSNAILNKGEIISVNPDLWNDTSWRETSEELSGQHQAFMGPTPIPAGLRKALENETSR